MCRFSFDVVFLFPDENQFTPLLQNLKDYIQPLQL